MTESRFSSPYFAAIDLGSNSFHMLVVRINEAKIEIVDREKEMVQIARGIEPDGKLNDQAVERAINCLTRFSERLRDIPQEQIRAVGTKTLRSIRNAKTFIKNAERALSTDIQIVSGFEEARLVYAGLSNTVINEGEQRLVIDIGGGSTEFVIGKDYNPRLLESLPLGCVSFTKNFIDEINKSSMNKAYWAARNEVEEIRKQYLSLGWDRVYGTSGTMKAVAELVSESDGGAVITRESLKSLYNHVIKEGSLPSADIPKLRREVLPSGIAIIRGIFDELNIDTLHVADATLKEGLIYDTIGRFSDHDARANTVNTLMVQYQIDESQANRVSELAVKFWKQTQGPTLAGVSRTKILRWAAKLHEVGINISHSSYHRHGYYLLRHSDLGGFGRNEQYVLANLVRYHRRKLPDESFIELDEESKQGFFPLLMCLRLAVCLCRRREDLDHTPQLSRDDGVYKVEFEEGYLASHPLTLAGIEKEVHYFKQQGIELVLAD